MFAGAYAAAVLLAAGQPGASRRIERCGSDWAIVRCSDAWTHHLKPFPCVCGHRLCERCAPARSARLVRQYQEAVEAMDAPTMLTFTCRNLPALTADTLRGIKRAFHELRRSRAWKGHRCSAACRACPEAASHGRCPDCRCPGDNAHPCPPGCTCRAPGRHPCTEDCKACRRSRLHWAWHAADCGHRYAGKDGTWRTCRCPGPHPGIPAGILSVEVTCHAHDDGYSWHPHIHAIADVRKPISAWALGAAWHLAAAGQGLESDPEAGQGVHIQRVGRGMCRRDPATGRRRHDPAPDDKRALAYALGYLAKSDLPEDEGAHVAYARAIFRIRLAQPFGTLRAKRPPGALACCAACAREWWQSASLRPAEHVRLEAKIVAIEKGERGARAAAQRLVEAGAPRAHWRLVGLASSLAWDFGHRFWSLARAEQARLVEEICARIAASCAPASARG